MSSTIAPLANLAAQVTAEASRVRLVADRVQRKLWGWTLGAVLVGWGLGGAGGCLLMVVMFGGETEPHDVEYVWWDTPERGRCLAEVQRSGPDEIRLDLGRVIPLEPGALAGVEAFSVEALVGRRVARRRGGGWPEETGTVARVYGTRGRSNVVELTLDDGETTVVRGLDELCLLE